MSLCLTHIYLNLVFWKCGDMEIWKHANDISTFQHFNASTFQHFNTSTFQHFNISTFPDYQVKIRASKLITHHTFSRFKVTLR